jgi:hypothetical protein
MRTTSQLLNVRLELMHALSMLVPQRLDGRREVIYSLVRCGEVHLQLLLQSLGLSLRAALGLLSDRRQEESRSDTASRAGAPARR